MMTIFEIESVVQQLANQIGASGDILPTFTRTEDGARPHIEVDSLGYHFVIVERGQELQRLTTTEIDELLFNIFESVTFNLACQYELQHRMRDQDIRRILFQHQVELLSSLSEEWGERQVRTNEKVLELHPFNDRRRE